MASFNYKAVDKKNKIISGTMKSASKRRIRKKLEKDGSTVLFIVPEKNSAFSLRSLPFLSRFSTAERINFFRNLAAMVVAGVTVSDSLRVLKEQMPNKQAKKAVSEMIGDIENGQKLSIAMKKAPKKYFSEFLIEAVNVGEVSGKTHYLYHPDGSGGGMQILMRGHCCRRLQRSWASPSSSSISPERGRS